MLTQRNQNLFCSLLPDELVIVRHGESIGNIETVDKKTDGNIPNHEYPLTDRGIEQCRYVQEYLKNCSFTLGFVSTFKRSQQSFNIILPGQPHIEDPRINEWWKGIFHSMTKNEIAQHYPGENVVRKKEGSYHYRPPQGESGMDVDVRILSFLQMISTAGLAQKVFISGHGRWIVSLLRLIQGRPVSDFEIMQKDKEHFPANGSLTIVRNTFRQDGGNLNISYMVPWKGKV